jgi:glycine/D-amino acid oxidase-like deaminating enzyme
MDTTKSAVAIIGGGVIGCAAYWHSLLAKARVQIHKYLEIP